MRGRSSRGLGGGKGGMVIDNKLDKLKDEPHLSGAYIRSLVKQLTSSRSKDPTNPREDPDGVDGFPGHQNLTKFGEVSSEGQPQPPPPPQPPHKKQVRRRLHTSRPYQERLLNMAEARREIVTALKFHRAAMKQANEQQQQPPMPPPQQAQPQPQTQTQPLRLPAQQSSSVQEGKIKSRRNPRIYPSNNSSSFSHYVENLSYRPTFGSSSPNPYPWPTSQIAPPPAITETENLNLALPNQTLGLNLNFHDFNNLDATLYHNSSNRQSIYSSSMSPSSLSSTTSPSPTTLSVATDQEVPTSMMTGSGGGGLSLGIGLHPAMDDEEIAVIRSIGEQHQMEWNDTMNLVTSAWWFKFLKTTEIGPAEDKGEDDDGHGYHPFDEKVMEIPAWLNANDSCLHQHYFNQHCLDDCLQDPALLPCMDIGEIEGMDEEWLA